jgi:hypothetical protein
VIEHRKEWATWVTPRALRTAPIHRWYTFPHSFTHQLVDALSEEWGLGASDLLLDPFVGAGTTVLAARFRGISAVGHDLSPLAVFVSRVKSAGHKPEDVQSAWERLLPRLRPAKQRGTYGRYPALVTRALAPEILGAFEGINSSVARMRCAESTKQLFQLALFATIPEFSQAVATGGWLSWIPNRRAKKDIIPALEARVEAIINDITNAPLCDNGKWVVSCADARRLPEGDSTITAVITSPPYPNRHDYTRVFGVELMFGFLDWEQTRDLRRQSFHSHPESRPDRPESSEYERPPRLTKLLRRLSTGGVDEKIVGMVDGYFLDIFLCLRELKRVCASNAPIALVLGNARYAGIPVLVDEWTASIGEQAGLRCERIRAVRFRGNSAQQMGTYGRTPSRESVIIFRNTKDGCGGREEAAAVSRRLSSRTEK